MSITCLRAHRFAPSLFFGLRTMAESVGKRRPDSIDVDGSMLEGVRRNIFFHDTGTCICNELSIELLSKVNSYTSFYLKAPYTVSGNF